MELIISKNGQEFLDRYTDVMMQQEVLYLLLMGNAQVDRGQEACEESFYGAVMDEGHPVLLFGNKAPYRLLIYRMQDGDITEALGLLVEYIYSHEITLYGILASEEICQQFFTVETKNKYKRGHGMDIMELRQLNDIPLVEGHLRLAEMKDLELLALWHQNFRVDCDLTDRVVSYEEERENLIHKIDSGISYVYEDAEGELASMAFISRKLNKGVCVSGVYTPPEKRGMRYCASMMYKLAEQMLNSGYEYLGLFVDKANPISNRVYKKVGYNIIVDSIEYDRTGAV